MTDSQGSPLLRGLLPDRGKQYEPRSNFEDLIPGQLYFPRPGRSYQPRTTPEQDFAAPYEEAPNETH